MTVAFMQNLGPTELLVMLFLIGALVLWISALVSVAKRSDLPPNSKLLWIVFLVIAGFATAIIYWIIRLVTRNKGIPDIKTFE